MNSLRPKNGLSNFFFLENKKGKFNPMVWLIQLTTTAAASYFGSHEIFSGPQLPTQELPSPPTNQELTLSPKKPTGIIRYMVFRGADYSIRKTIHGIKGIWKHFTDGNGAEISSYPLSTGPLEFLTTPEFLIGASILGTATLVFSIFKKTSQYFSHRSITNGFKKSRTF